jgi:hypothetical protein
MGKRRTRGDWLREHVDYAGDVCLIWPFRLFPNGYPLLGCTGAGGKLQPFLYGHRYMCELVNGPAPAGHEAAHSCNNRSCVNPRHLSWKTRAGNQADRIIAGTNHRPGRKLTPKQLAEVRALKGKMTQREIAKLYGVTFQSVSIVHQRDSTRESQSR